MSWSDLAKTGQADAALAKEHGRRRMALNRCYYALFSEITRGSLVAGYTMPSGWEGPHHHAVYQGRIIANHLAKWLRPDQQSRLIYIASVLYKLRIDADYSPSAELTDSDVRLAFGRLIEGRQIMESVQ